MTNRASRSTPYMFNLAVEGIELADEDIVETLVSGDFEVYPAVVAGKSTLTYRIFADSGYDAVIDAVSHVRSLFPDVAVCRVELDLVSISDIANRVERPRESVRAWALGTRGPGGFPAPLSVVGDKVRVWDWPSVNDWLRRAEIEGFDNERLLSREEIDELNVMLVRRFVGRSVQAFRQDDLVSGSTTLTVRSAKVDPSIVTYGPPDLSAIEAV